MANEALADIDMVEDFLTTLDTPVDYIVKDPRISLLAPIWIEAASRQNWDVRFVIVFREPGEVVRSYGRLVGLSPAHAADVWIRYNILAERQTRGFARAFLSYSRLLADWRSEINAVSEQANLPINPDEAGIENFLSKDLHRERSGGNDIGYISDRLTQQYCALLEARTLCDPSA